MELNRKIRIAEGIALLALLTLAFCLGILYAEGELDKLFLGLRIDKSNINCTGDSVFQVSKCLNNELSSWFKYNLSQSGKELNETELIEYGGVCRHAALWYIEKAKQSNRNGEYIRFCSGDECHAVAVIYNKDLTSYCILDQTDLLGCNFLK